MSSIHRRLKLIEATDWIFGGCAPAERLSWCRIEGERDRIQLGATNATRNVLGRDAVGARRTKSAVSPREYRGSWLARAARARRPTSHRPSSGAQRHSARRDARSDALPSISSSRPLRSEIRMPHTVQRGSVRTVGSTLYSSRYVSMKTTITSRSAVAFRLGKIR